MFVSLAFTPTTHYVVFTLHDKDGHGFHDVISLPCLT